MATILTIRKIFKPRLQFQFSTNFVTCSKSNSHWPLSIVSAATSLVNMILPILLVRILPQESIGDYKIFFLYLSLAPAFAFIAGLVSNIPYWSSQNENNTETLKASFQLVLFSASVFTLIAFCFDVSIADSFSWTPRQADLFALAIFGTVAHQFIEDCLISRGKIWTSSLFSGFFEILKGISLVFSAWYWRDTTFVFAAFAIVMALKVATAITIGIKNKLLSWSINWDYILKVSKRAAPISLAALFSIFLDKADQFVLSSYLSSSDFATYSLGCLIVPPLLSLESSIMRVSIPQLAVAISQNNFANAARLHRYTIEQLALLIIPASFGMIVFADPIISLLFTSEYSAAAGFLRIFSFSYIILILPFDASARAVGNTNWIFKNFISFSILCFISACIGAWLFGSYGALIATILAKTLMRLSGLRFTKKTLKCSYKDLLPIFSLATELSLLIVISIICILLQPLFKSSLLWLSICGISFIGTYLPIAIILRNRSSLRLSSQPKILLLVQSLQIGGLEKMVISLGTELAKDSKLDLQIFAYDQPKLPACDMLSELARRNNLKLIEQTKRAGFSFPTLISLLKIIFKDQVNIVHTHNIGPLIYAGIARVVSLGRFRIIHSNHSFTELEAFPRYRIYEKIFSKLCSQIIAVSPEIMETYIKLGVPPEKLSIIPNGVDTNKEISLHRKDKIAVRQLLLDTINLRALNNFIESKWIIVVARLHPLKGQDYAIEIWNSLSTEIKEKACLIFVGPDSEPSFAQKVKDFAKQADESNRIIFAGPTNNPQQWYSCADIFLSSSQLEGMPLAPIEAIISGLPLILTKIEGHRFLSAHAELVSISDPLSAANSLSSLILAEDNSSAYEKLVVSATWAQSNFSIEAMTSKYLEHYREILR